MGRKIHICPECESDDVTSQADHMTDIAGMTRTWKCNECGYTGAMPEVDEEDL